MGSNLDPNSPCFYPSNFNANSTNPIWQPDGMRPQNGHGGQIGHQGQFGPYRRDEPLDFFIPPYNSYKVIAPYECKNFAGGHVDPMNRFKKEIPFGYGKKEDCFFPPRSFPFYKGYAEKRKFVQGRDEDRRPYGNGRAQFWHNKSMVREKNYEIPLQGNGLRVKLYNDCDNGSKDQFGLSTMMNFPDNAAGTFSNHPYKSPGSAFEMPTGINYSSARKDATAHEFMPGNGSYSNRLRIVRKRQDGPKVWKQTTDQQFNLLPVNCPSCKLEFKWPHLLSCLHSFCFSCVAKNLDQELNEIKCPICSTLTELNDNNVVELDLDFTTCKNLLQSKRINPFSCMACSRDKYATMYCQECLKYICAECQDSHKNDTDTSSHTLRKVAKMTEYQGKLFEVCSTHSDKILNQYCEDCKQLVCDQCTIKGEQHNNHVLGNMDKLYHSAMNKIRLINDSMDEVRNEIQKRIQPLTILKQQIETNVRLCKQDIHKYSNSLLAETERCRTKARLVVDKAHEDFTKDIEDAENMMIRYMSEFSPVLDFFRRYVYSSKLQELMRFLPLILKKLDQMADKHKEIKKREGIFDTNVSFKANYAGINEYLQNQYNQILITENLSDALPSDSTEMGRRIEKDIIAAMERSSNHFSPSGSTDLDHKTTSGTSTPEEADPQSEIFNYNRTGINFIHQFGSYGRGEYEFVEPSGVLFLLDGSLAVCDTANHRIMVYDNQFKYLRTIGQPPNLPPLRDRKEAEASRNDKHFSRTQSCLYFPYRIAQCPQTENIVVIERPPSRDIQIFTVLGQFINCFGSDILQHPRGVAVDEHGVIVTVEGRTMKLMLFSQEGRLLHRFFLSVHLEFPNDVAARDGLIYISDNRGHCVHVFDYHAEHKRTIGHESVTYYPIGVSLTHLNQVVVTDNHNTFNISVFNAWPDGQYAFGFKSKVRHANCYNVTVHPHRFELAVTSRENQVVVFNFDPLRSLDDEKDQQPDQVEVKFRH